VTTKSKTATTSNVKDGFPLRDACEGVEATPLDFSLSDLRISMY
jgi:hypothetical protein